MPDIGRASLLIVPRFDNLTKSVDDALQRAGATASKSGQGLGESTTKGFGSGIAKSGALIGAFSAITNAAMSSISSHVGDAVARFDTLNQYPRTMELLGYSSESAEASINKMSDRLSTLPTRLDDMTSMVQGIVAITGDLDQATDAGLALNDMLVASGSSTQLTTAAMEQFRQMLAKGKPEMEDWKSLTSAMPGQMSQLAKAMLGPTATANDLYYALGGGGQDPTLTMDDLLSAMIRLDTEGGEGITSFREQAETAAGGVQTAMSNMGNAITKGIAGVMDEIGQDRISGVLNDLKGGINDFFGVARDLAGDVAPVLSSMYESVAPLAPQIIASSAAFAAFNGVGGKVAGTFKGLSDNAKKLKPDMDLLTTANTLLGTSFDPVSLAVTGVSAALAVGVTAWMDYTERQENFATATRGLNDVVSDTAALEGYRGTVDGVGESAGLAAMSVDELAESTAARVETMRANTEAAETEIAQLNTAQGIINDYIGATDLSAEAQGRLEWALSLVNDEFGLNISQADVAAGKYKDAEGNVVDLRDSINDLIDAKKEEARVTAITSNLTEAYEAQGDAAETLAQAQKDYNDKVLWYMEAQEKNGNKVTRAGAEAWAATTKQGQALESATEQYKAASAAVESYEGQLGEAAAATSEASDEYDRLSTTMGSAKFELFSAQLRGAGTSTTMLAEDLRSLGVDTEAFSALSEDRLQELAYTYDGTTESIVGLLRDWGVSMDETASASAEGSAEIAAALSGMSSSAAVDLGLLATKMSEAGVQAGTLNEIGTANLDALAVAVGGDVDAMVWAVQNWNQLPFVSKDGDVTVEDGQLVDAQGRVWVWNGSRLVPLSTTAQVSGNVPTGQAQRAIDDTNASARAMKSRTVTDTVQGSALTSAGKIWDTVNAIGSLNSKDVYVNTHYTTYDRTIKILQGAWAGDWGKSGNAAGGIRLYAAGGILPRYHAAGAIATRAVPLDIVGEDGAEAIVPLTNRKYSQPFADVISEGVSERITAGTTNLYVDGSLVAVDSRIAQALSTLLDAVERRYDMGGVRA